MRTFSVLYVGIADMKLECCKCFVVRLGIKARDHFLEDKSFF